MLRATVCAARPRLSGACVQRASTRAVAVCGVHPAAAARRRRVPARGFWQGSLNQPTVAAAEATLKKGEALPENVKEADGTSHRRLVKAQRTRARYKTRMIFEGARGRVSREIQNDARYKTRAIIDRSVL